MNISTYEEEYLKLNDALRKSTPFDETQLGLVDRRQS
jgi:hypothetical protein